MILQYANGFSFILVLRTLPILVVDAGNLLLCLYESYSWLRAGSMEQGTDPGKSFSPSIPADDTSHRAPEQMLELPISTALLILSRPCPTQAYRDFGGWFVEGELRRSLWAPRQVAAAARPATWQCAPVPAQPSIRQTHTFLLLLLFSSLGALRS